LPMLPPRALCLGVEFIEFAMDDQAAPPFERLLAALGFCRAGEHVSKAVTRWRQGDINIVVNLEKEGFAHSYYITHGTGVCAIGLQVDDAAAALDRAQLLFDTPFRQAVGSGELEIPAVRGLGGSLIYFLDAKTDLGTVWDIEFQPVSDSQAEAGLKSVDHIAQSMLYSEMLSWLLFYTSLLDVAKSAEQDVLDPGGLVRSQVVHSQDGRLRVVLNGSQSNRTQSSRFLSEAFGSGVQHIAFATDDLVATVKHLETNGVELLPVPENYYDDLEAKGELSSDLVDTLRAHNIFYDRDGDAEYLQVYTLTVEDRFFFEIVERRGYQGYGASNAPVRLAAQTRLSAGKSGADMKH
jgi:4-hydroxyphenylpyruvate dioxygenase